MRTNLFSSVPGKLQQRPAAQDAQRRRGPKTGSVIKFCPPLTETKHLKAGYIIFGEIIRISWFSNTGSQEGYLVVTGYRIGTGKTYDFAVV